MPTLHPAAIISPAAALAEDVRVGPGAVIEPDVTIGPGCSIGEYAVIRRYTTMGRDNVVDAHCVLGGLPQDLKFDRDAVTHLRIGDGNVFREGVTISRATRPGGATVVGSRTYWMAGSHAGHDATVGDEAVLVNHATLAGHTALGRGAILSAYAGVHQFCWVGDLVMVQGHAGATMHVPPYVILGDGINKVFGLNTVGLRRAKHLTDEDRRQIKEAFALLYRAGLTPAKALERMDACADWGEAATTFRDFVRKALSAQRPYNRGLCPRVRRPPGNHRDAEE